MSGCTSGDKFNELIPAYRDTFVHYLFGSAGNEPLLLHFLNAVLESDGQPLAKSVEMRNPFNPQTFVADKFTILDVKATDERGDIFVVEFQTSERTLFADRMTYYGSRAFSSQMLLGHPYSSLNAVIAIAVTAFEMFPQLEGVHNSFRLTAKSDPSVVFTNLLQMHILEAAAEKIGRVKKLPSSLSAWVHFFYYSHRKSEVEMSTLLQDQAAVGLAYDKYRQFNQDARMRALDEAHQRYLHDQASDLEEAHLKGQTEGRVEGIAIGEARGKAEAVLSVLRSRFRNVPKEVETAIRQIIDPIALDSWVVQAAVCKSLDEFAETLK